MIRNVSALKSKMFKKEIIVSIVHLRTESDFSGLIAGQSGKMDINLTLQIEFNLQRSFSLVFQNSHSNSSLLHFQIKQKVPWLTNCSQIVILYSKEFVVDMLNVSRALKHFIFFPSTTRFSN